MHSYTIKNAKNPESPSQLGWVTLRTCLRNKIRYWRDGSAIKNTNCSCREPKLDSWLPHQVTHKLSVVLALRNWMPLTSMVPGTQVHIPIHVHITKNNIFLKKNKLDKNLSTHAVICKVIVLNSQVIINMK